MYLKYKSYIDERDAIRAKIRKLTRCQALLSGIPFDDTNVTKKVYLEKRVKALNKNLKRHIQVLLTHKWSKV